MLSIVVPTKNEVGNIRDTIYELIDVMRDLHQRYEILIMDSNSRDGTQYLAGRLAGRFPIRVINCGKLDLAQSIVKGLILARGEYIIVTDGDGQHDIPSIKQMWDWRDDVVINGASPNSGVRGFLSSLARYTARKSIPKLSEFKYPTSGFFMVKRQVIRDIKWSSTGFKVLPEILVKGKHHGAVEFSTHLRKRCYGSSKFSIRDMVKYLFQLKTLRDYHVQN
jgi:dolichol-phosphate mannosyltransferase